MMILISSQQELLLMDMLTMICHLDGSYQMMVMVVDMAKTVIIKHVQAVKIQLVVTVLLMLMLLT